MSDLAMALVSLRNRVVAMSARDPQPWLRDSDGAWVWGVLVGWERGDPHPDGTACDCALRSVAAEFRWTVEQTAELLEFRAAVKEATQ